MCGVPPGPAQGGFPYPPSPLAAGGGHPRRSGHA